MCGGRGRGDPTTTTSQTGLASNTSLASSSKQQPSLSLSSSTAASDSPSFGRLSSGVVHLRQPPPCPPDLVLPGLAAASATDQNVYQEPSKTRRNATSALFQNRQLPLPPPPPALAAPAFQGSGLYSNDDDEDAGERTYENGEMIHAAMLAMNATREGALLVDQSNMECNIVSNSAGGVRTHLKPEALRNEKNEQ